MRLKRNITLLVLILIGLPILLTAALIGLAATEKGSLWLIENTARRLPGQFDAGKIQGTLLSRLEVYNLSYESPPHHLRIAHLTLAWRPWALTAKQLIIDELAATGIHYQGPASQEAQPSKPTGLPQIRLPLAIEVKRLHLQDAVVKRGAETMTLQRLDFKGDAVEQALNIQQLQLEAPSLSASLHGRLTLTGDYPLQAEIDWRYRMSEPATAPATFHGHGKLSGTLAQLVIHHRLSQPFVFITKGTLHPLQQPIQADLKGHWQNLHWPPVEAELQSAQGNYHIHGNPAAYTLALTGQFNGPNLPAGDLTLTGKGDLRSFHLKKALVHTLKGQIHLQGNLAWQPEIDWNFHVRGSRINPGEIAPQWPGQLHFTGYSQGRFGGEAAEFEITIQSLTGKLRGHPVEAIGKIIYRQDQWRFQALNVKSGRNRLHLNGQLGKQLDLHFKFEGKDLSGAWPTLAGQLYAQGRLKGPTSQPRMQMTAHGKRLRWQDNRLHTLEMVLNISPQDPDSHARLRLQRLSLNDINIGQLTIKARGNFASHTVAVNAKLPQGRIRTHLKGNYADQRWRVSLGSLSFRAANGKSMAFPEHGRLHAAFTLDFKAAPIPIAGQIDATLPDISRLSSWMPPLERPKGRLTLATLLSGTLAKPLVTGEIYLTGGAATIKAAGIRLQKVRLSAINRDGRRFNLHGRGHSGEGWLKVRGWLEPFSTPPAMRLSMKGEAFEIARLPQARVEASPDLEFHLENNLARLQGKVSLPKAKIKIKELPPEAITVSEDEVILGKPKTKPPVPLKLTSDVRLELGKDVRFKGYGLKAKLTGYLKVHSQDSQATAHGVIYLKQGKYKAFAQEIDITSGKLIFNGPVDNPYLDLQAVRKIDNDGVTVTLRVKGPLIEPVLTVTSQPPLPKTEALAYFLTGHSFESGGGNEKTMIANAALSLGTRLARPWLKRLGLDEIKVKTGATQAQTALTLGKYLTPDLYVGYAFNLFNGQGAALMRYRVSKRIALEAQSGASQSLDVFYTLETD